ncbi:unnamed protein product [Polarella glacialis]|uniref:Uncharacterized protein n=1 Tax=Polarella glacialis TaxID=89957 RepID=A0A813D9R4_POLGL|nr:unnamed protein product [Polarella glacialis]CAE8674661.1 unnamed protein product [Polarella glacialis]
MSLGLPGMQASLLVGDTQVPGTDAPTQAGMSTPVLLTTAAAGMKAAVEGTSFGQSKLAQIFEQVEQNEEGLVRLDFGEKKKLFLKNEQQQTTTKPARTHKSILS